MIWWVFWNQYLHNGLVDCWGWIPLLHPNFRWLADPFQLVNDIYSYLIISPTKSFAPSPKNISKSIFNSNYMFNYFNQVPLIELHISNYIFNYDPKVCKYVLWVPLQTLKYSTTSQNPYPCLHLQDSKLQWHLQLHLQSKSFLHQHSSNSYQSNSNYTFEFQSTSPTIFSNPQLHLQTSLRIATSQMHHQNSGYISQTHMSKYSNSSHSFQLFSNLHRAWVLHSHIYSDISNYISTTIQLHIQAFFGLQLKTFHHDGSGWTSDIACRIISIMNNGIVEQSHHYLAPRIY